MMAILGNKWPVSRPHFLVLALTLLLSHMTLAVPTSDGDIRDVGQSVPSIGNTPVRLDVGISVNTKVRNKSGTDMEAAFRETEALLIGQRLRGELEQNDDWGGHSTIPGAFGDTAANRTVVHIGV